MAWTTSETDTFDRLLRNVWIDDGGVLKLVGLELVRQGFAQVATYPPDEAMRLARWKFGYRLHEIAYATGFSEATVSRRTRPTKPSTPR